MRTRRLAALAVAALSLAGCAVTPPAPASAPAPAPTAPGLTDPAPTPSASVAPPKLYAEVVVGGLVDPTDLEVLPDGRGLVAEKAGRLVLLSTLTPGATATRVHADLADVVSPGDAGLTGLALAPDFASSRVFATCQAHAESGRPVDVRVVRWQLSADGTRADRVQDLLVGIPLDPAGVNSGCRLGSAADGTLLVGTGDAHIPSAAQSPVNLGGKVLRLNPLTGQPAPDNPDAAASGLQRYVVSTGHRAVTGIAVPATGTPVVIESGPGHDDEAAPLRPGGNHGWDPSVGGTSSTYDATVPMTDETRFPDAVRPTWRSGTPGLGASDGAFLTGDEWGPWNRGLAVTTLDGRQVVVLPVDGTRPGPQYVPVELHNEFGRLRAATFAGGALYVTTGNGSGDVVVRVSPAVG